MFCFISDQIKKEAKVLSDSSLQVLAKEINDKALVLAMYLNIPTTTVVLVDLESKECDPSTLYPCNAASSLLKRWKVMRAGAKDKDKVLDLERALRSTGKDDVADILMDKHRDNQELSQEIFAQ